MQFKFPKKIIIGSVEFDIKYNKNHDGGEFSFPNEKRSGYIEIGTRTLKTNPLRFFEVVIHELKEIIQQLQHTRYVRCYDDDGYEFHYTHKEHDHLCSELAGLLTKFIK